ncbi:MAG: DVUA0089 family protein, partial [Hyphomonadaceae bacterium]|nr:DVUA0089 family protein [Hyphomonadaceae bacterium]
MRAALFALVLVGVTAVASASGGQTYSGEVSGDAPRALFSVRLDAGEVVTLTTDPNAGFDTVLQLIAPNGQEVAANDDWQEGDLSSRIIYRARARGEYTIVVTGYGGAAGSFDVNITRGVDFNLSSDARTLREDTVSFSPSRTEQRYEVRLAADDIFVGSTYALTADLDTTLALVDSRGTVIAQNDDRGDGTLNSQIVHQIERGGRYTVIASTYGGNGVGDAAISLAVDPNARPPFNFEALAGTPVVTHEGALNAETAERQYTLELAAGQTILALADTVSGDLDPVLRLNDADGYPVALNDDRGDGSLNAGFAFTAPQAATYTLIIERYRGSDTSGDYRIAITNVDESVVDTIQALLENAVELSGEPILIQTENFNLYYTTEGRDASTPEYAQAVSEALQEIYDIQITQMGWAEPVRDEDGRYRAYVAHANGAMGYTKPVQIVFDNP